VPLEYIEGGVCFRPPHIDIAPFSTFMKDHTYGWTQPILLSNITTYEENTEQIDCHEERNRVLPWSYSVQFEANSYRYSKPYEESAKHPSLKITSHTYKDYKITLRAPLVVENLLASSTLFHLVEGKFNTPLVEGKLKSGEWLEFYHSTSAMDDHLLVGFCPKGFEWSKLIPVQSNSNQEIDFEVSDQSERPLVIKMENRVNACKTRKLSIWTEYCIINQTGLNLTYGFNGGKHIAAGPGKKSILVEIVL
jgi:hypothetical protein